MTFAAATFLAGASERIAVSLLLVAAALSTSDVQRLERYGAAPALDPGEVQRFDEQARADFAGRGVEIANHFLLHTDARPRNDAYFFVLRAVGDVDAALTLIRALPNPPAHESGILDRHFGEIAVAIEAVLTDEAVGGDPRVAAALDEAVGAARRKPHGSGRHEALAAVRLIGMCRTAQAAQALARLAGDSDPTIRAAAADALGEFKTPVGTPAADPVSPARELLRILSSDSSPVARRQAAESLGSVDAPDAVPGLRAALGTEQHSPVVDAVVQSLRRRGVPIEDPVECRRLIGRTWEARVAEQMLDCWRRSGLSSEQLEQMALTGAAPERAVALFALSTTAAQTRSLILARDPEPARFDPVLRDRLLDAGVWALSHGDNISASARDRAEQALWNLSERSMGRALEYADRVTPTEARFRASEELARADRAAYDATRRRQQTAVALFTAVALGLLGLLRSPLSKPAWLMSASAIGWAAWTAQASGARDLPPPPLWFLTVAAIAFLSAGATTAVGTSIARRPGPGGRPLVRAALTIIMAGIVAGIVCSATRNARLFPGGREGWELIFDPLGAVFLAVVAAAILVVVEPRLPSRAS